MEATIESEAAAYAHIFNVETTHTDPTKRKQILHEMMFQFPDSSITAIMGPSGSGKTTLLNFLTGSVSRGVLAEGKVVLNGRHAFVPQDDRLHGFYTCKSYMKHYAFLSGLKGTTTDAEDKHMDQIFEGLGLTGHKNTIVGDLFRKGLSGGQKRRLSVALEALSSPETLFLDEPTSGLDAESAYRMMCFLREYAKPKGRRVILTIHQPSSFLWKLIDNVILLSRGKLMYEGPRKRMTEFFADNDCPCPSDYNPADHFVTLVNDEFVLHQKSVDDWADSFQDWKLSIEDSVISESDVFSQSSGRLSINSSLSAKRGLVRSSSYFMASVRLSRASINSIEIKTVPSSRADWFHASLALTQRYFLNLWLNPGILGTRVAMYSMLSLLIGALFYNLGDNDSYSSVQSRIALQFYCVAFFVFMSVAVLPFTVMERAIVEKEVRNGYYHPAVFQLAQAIASVPGTFLLALITTVIVISLTGLREPIWYFINMFLALCCAEALAHLVSHVVPHFIIGMAVLAGIYGMFMLLQGFMIVPSEFPSWLGWSYNIAFHTYSWRSFMYSEFSGDDVRFESAEFRTGFDVLRLYEIDDVNRTHDMIVLLCYSICVHLLSFIVLHVKYVMFK